MEGTVLFSDEKRWIRKKKKKHREMREWEREKYIEVAYFEWNENKFDN